MTGILVKDGATVVAKDVFSGDVSGVLAEAEQLQTKNPALTYEVHQDTDPDWQKAFMNVDIVQPPTGWQVAKAAGTAQALVFIAKFLGLE